MVSTWLESPEVQFVLQPLVSLSSAQPIGYEILARPAANGTPLPVEQFFRHASEEGLAAAVDQTLIPKIVEHLDDISPDLPVFVNLHPESLIDRGIQSQLMTGIRSLVIEVTERAEWRVAALEEFLRSWQEQGGRFALDDFGSGYSGLEKLIAVRPNYVKLDSELVRHCDQSQVKRNIMGAVSQLASILAFELLGEGIETERELATCIDLGVTMGQGFLFCRPMPWKEKPHIESAVQETILQQFQLIRQLGTASSSLYSDWEYHAALLDDLLREEQAWARIEIISQAVYRVLKPHSVTVMAACAEGLQPVVSVGHAHRRLMSWEAPSLAKEAYQDQTVLVRQHVTALDGSVSRAGELHELLGSPASVAISPVGQPVWGVVGADFMAPNAWTRERINALKALARLMSLTVSAPPADMVGIGCRTLEPTSGV